MFNNVYITTLCIILLVWYLVSYCKWWINIYRPLRKLPQELRLPIVGTKYKLFGIKREGTDISFKLTTKRYIGINN